MQDKCVTNHCCTAARTAPVYQDCPPFAKNMLAKLTGNPTKVMKNFMDRQSIKQASNARPSSKTGMQGVVGTVGHKGCTCKATSFQDLCRWTCAGHGNIESNFKISVLKFPTLKARISTPSPKPGKPQPQALTFFLLSQVGLASYHLGKYSEAREHFAAQPDQGSKSCVSLMPLPKLVTWDVLLTVTACAARPTEAS